jgi:uncharacterized heparinase superfamily protein
LLHHGPPLAREARLTDPRRLRSTLSSAWRSHRARASERRWRGRIGTRILELGQPPEFPVFRPEDIWPGDVERANALFRGRYDFGCGVVETREAPWQAQAPCDRWLETLHGFTWLRDFAASPTDSARRQVRALVQSWLDTGQHQSAAWRAPVVARRLTAWATYAPLVLEGGDEAYRQAVLRSARRAAGYLSRTAGNAAPGLPSLIAACGLVYAGLVLPGGDRRYRRGIALLQRAIEDQVLPDGGHASRNPAAIAEALAELAGLRRALLASSMPAPSFLLMAIDRLAPMLRFFRHQDGGLAQFNGSTEAAGGDIDRILAAAEARGRPFHHAPHSGYYRLLGGRTLVLIEAGRPPPPFFDQDAHAGCLAFEMSSGSQRLIVNCGEGTSLGAEWRRATRVTAAHSTVSIDDKSSCTFRDGGLGHGIARGPEHVPSSRHVQDGRSWVEAEHDGYGANVGLTHRRRLYLGEDGGDLRGEDTLSSKPGQRVRSGTAFARFHLHPSVEAAQADGEGAIALTLPDGEAWQFRARGGATSLEDSVYVGPGKAAPARQIVVTAPCAAEGVALQWALRRMP